MSSLYSDFCIGITLLIFDYRLVGLKRSLRILTNMYPNLALASWRNWGRLKLILAGWIVAVYVAVHVG